MNGRLLYYNPWNDLALAANVARFTPPAGAVAMADGGALLPLWWAKPDDYVFARPEMAAAAGQICRRFNLNGSIFSDSMHTAGLRPSPWGWSRATRSVFASTGIEAAILPSDNELDTMRSLSHRELTAEVHRQLGTPEGLIPHRADTAEEAISLIHQAGNAVIKLPWSCSGRGVMFSSRIPPQELHRRISGMIRRQGSVMIEPQYTPRAEYGALYLSSATRVQLQGFSKTISSADGKYAGNIAAPQSYIISEAGDEITSTARNMEPILTRLFSGKYNGWLGVDMLLHSKGLNPCMEINLRMTMGVAAMFIADRLYPHAGKGVIYTSPRMTGGADINLSPTGVGLTVAFTPN